MRRSARRWLLDCAFGPLDADASLACSQGCERRIRVHLAEVAPRGQRVGRHGIHGLADATRMAVICGSEDTGLPLDTAVLSRPRSSRRG